MTLVELKNFITNNTVPSDFIILVNKDNKFLAKQYIQALGTLAPGGIHRISSIYEPFQSSLTMLTAPVDCLNVLVTDTFDERAENYFQFENTVVVCEQIDKSISTAVKDFTIVLPKLEEWQILDYAKMMCPALEDEDLEWLINITDKDMERIINELDKVKLFTQSEQKHVFSSIRFDPQTDLFKVDLFTVVNSLIDGDLMVLFEFLKRKDCDKLDPIVLANRTLSSLKNIILVTQNPNLTAEACGVTSAQRYAIMNKYRSLNVEAAKQKLKFLVNIDLALKSSQLEMSKGQLLDYLVTNLSYKITL